MALTRPSLLPPLPKRSPASAASDAATDHDCIRAALAGSEDAFRRLVDRNERRAYWIAYQMVGNAEEARDIAQEAFVRVHRSLGRFDFSKAFTTWLHRIVTNLAIDHLRHASLLRPASLEEVGDAIPSTGERPEVAVEREETRRLVFEVLATLPPKFRRVLVLRDLQGFSGKEVSAIVGATHPTVRWRLHRARRLFRDRWEVRRRASEEEG